MSSGGRTLERKLARGQTCRGREGGGSLINLLFVYGGTGNGGEGPTSDAEKGLICYRDGT